MNGGKNSEDQEDDEVASAKEELKQQLETAVERSAERNASSANSDLDLEEHDVVLLLLYYTTLFYYIIEMNCIRMMNFVSVSSSSKQLFIMKLH